MDPSRPDNTETAVPGGERYRWKSPDLNELLTEPYILRFCFDFFSAMEFSPDRYRTPLGFGFQLVFALGIAAVAGWGYLIRDWPLLQIAFGLNSAMLLVHWW
jgi:hypothetical protein